MDLSGFGQMGMDIQATVTAGNCSCRRESRVRRRDDKVRLMLQNLLADRSKLVMRREVREVSAYVVVVAKNGPKLRNAATNEKDCPEIGANDGVSCHSTIGGQGNGIHGKAISVADASICGKLVGSSDYRRAKK